MNWSTERKLLAGFWGGLLVVLANGAIAVWSLQSILRNTEHVSACNRRILSLETLLSIVKDAETGQRGYVLTGDPSYLAPFRKAEANLEASEGALRDLMRSRPEQIPRIDRLDRLTDEKIFELRKVVAARTELGFEPAQQLIKSGVGKRLMDRVRGLVEEMKAEEGAQLSRYLQETNRAIRQSFINLLIASLVGAVCLGLIVRLVRRDLQARRLAEEAIRKSEAWLNTTLLGIGDAVIATDEVGRVVFMNHVAEALTGWSQAGAIGRPLEQVFRIVNETTREPVENPVAKVLRENQIVGLANHTTLISADGREIPIDDSGAPIRNEKGELLGVVLVFRDVTERRAIEQEVEHDRDLARSAVAARDEFLAMLSHELRTPLNPVLIATSAMLDGLPGEPELRSTLEMIYRNIELEARLIDDLLDVTRIRRGKMIYHFAVVNVHDVINRALTICEADVAAGGIVVKRELDATQTFVNADPGRLQQVVWNLVKNAVKFTPAGRSITVRTRNVSDPQRPRDLIEITVADQGIGISADLLPRLFDAFEQGENESGSHISGLGLGLAISRSVVVAHQGEISASSAGKGQGATFLVRLATVAEPAPASDPAIVAPGENAATACKRRILLVEDDPDTRNILCRLLRLDGHEITTADRCQSAREAWEAQPFDLLITDIGLPDGNGWDMIRQLQSIRRAPAIALTGFGMEDDVRRSRERGFLVHLTKPIDFAKLRDAIANAPADSE